jgi:hypothetical protein
MEKVIYRSGKIVFTSPEHAEAVQTELLQAGFTFPFGDQSPRTVAYGVMWKEGVMRTAANQNGFRGYGVPVCSSLEEAKMIHRPIRTPREPFTFEQRQEMARKASVKAKEIVEKRILGLMVVASKALHEIGDYRENLYGTNSKSELRRIAWEKYMQKCVEIAGEIPPENSLRSAINRVLSGHGKKFQIPASKRTKAAMLAAL